MTTTSKHEAVSACLSVLCSLKGVRRVALQNLAPQREEFHEDFDYHSARWDVQVERLDRMITYFSQRAISLLQKDLAE